MKKFLLTIAVSACVLIAKAGISVPIDFQPDLDAKDPLNGWTFYAPEGTPGGSYGPQLFPNYSPSNPVVVENINGNAIWTLSQYRTLMQASDTWVITPEIPVSYDTATLAFTVQVFGLNANQQNNYTIYVSEGGTAKEDFVKIDEGSVKGASEGADYIRQSSKRVHLDGYKGKKVRIAFVNQGNYAGMMGFTDIQVGAMYISSLPSDAFFNSMLFNKAEDNNIIFSFRASTPERTRNIAINLQTSGGYKYEQTLTKSLTISSIGTVNIALLNIPMSQDIEEYTLTLLPDYEGAEPIVMSGYLVAGNREFEAVGVMEDATGIWCGWCPFGIAALEYYQHYNNGIDGNKKAIGIGLHYSDVLEVPSKISDYNYGFFYGVHLPNGAGYPFVAVNRKYPTSPSPDPTTVGKALDMLYDQGSYADVKLDKVLYYPQESQTVYARYSLQTSFPTAYAPVSVSAILVEDNVQGNNADYNQHSYLAQQGYSSSRIMATYGEAWGPYFEPFDDVSEVLFNKIQYQDVARGSFPTYAGVHPDAFVPGQVCNGQIVFDMPSNVNIAENTRVVLLVTLDSTGEIIAADELAYDNYTFESGVGTIGNEDANINATLQNGNLNVYTSENATVEVYGIDGSQLLKVNAVAGDNNYSLNTNGNVVIVKVKSANATKTLKLIAK